MLFSTKLAESVLTYFLCAHTNFYAQMLACRATVAQTVSPQKHCTLGAAAHLLVLPSFRFFRFRFLSYNWPISRLCPSDDAPHGEWAILTRNFYLLLTLRVLIYLTEMVRWPHLRLSARLWPPCRLLQWRWRFNSIVTSKEDLTRSHVKSRLSWEFMAHRMGLTVTEIGCFTLNARHYRMLGMATTIVQAKYTGGNIHIPRNEPEWKDLICCEKHSPRTTSSRR